MTPAERETGLFYALLFFAPYLVPFYLAHAEANGGVPGRPDRALARFIRARWRQARGYIDSWTVEDDRIAV
jgi:hypothetical protein